ncbi:MAG: hypothetical protein ACI8WB_004017 [Phenylobacterium sp.]|jgi:hypothetical protein
MSITQSLATVAQAADSLTQQVSGKISQIDQRVTQFETDASDVVKAATAQISRAHIGIQQQPSAVLNITPEDDAGQLVVDAFASGNKHITIQWAADGQERHWNTLVSMPIGATLIITGPDSSVTGLGGNVRTDRACYANGARGGTSENGSPMIFKNLTASLPTFPAHTHFKVIDQSSLIHMHGNNTVFWGNGTYLHDQGGMCVYGYGNGLIVLTGHCYAMPSYVLGGSNYCQFYLSGPFVNQQGGSSTCEVRIMAGKFNKVSSDGPVLTADKGFKRLLDKGVSGVTTALLNLQPYEVTAEQSQLNDNEHIGYSFLKYALLRGAGEEADRPRILSAVTWHLGTGWIKAQFKNGPGELSTYGLTLTEGTDIYIGAA